MARYPNTDARLAPEDYGRGRICPGCGCYVCRYNPGPLCWPCQAAEPFDAAELARELGKAARRERLGAPRPPVDRPLAGSAAA